MEHRDLAAELVDDRGELHRPPVEAHRRRRVQVAIDLEQLGDVAQARGRAGLLLAAAARSGPPGRCSRRGTAPCVSVSSSPLTNCSSGVPRPGIGVDLYALVRSKLYSVGLNRTVITLPLSAPSRTVMVAFLSCFLCSWRLTVPAARARCAGACRRVGSRRRRSRSVSDASSSSARCVSRANVLRLRSGSGRDAVGAARTRRSVARVGDGTGPLETASITCVAEPWLPGCATPAARRRRARAHCAAGSATPAASRRASARRSGRGRALSRARPLRRRSLGSARTSRAEGIVCVTLALGAACARTGRCRGRVDAFGAPSTIARQTLRTGVQASVATASTVLPSDAA